MMNMAACALSPCPHQSAPPRRVAASPTLVVLLNLIHFELDQLHRSKTAFLLVHCNLQRPDWRGFATSTRGAATSLAALTTRSTTRRSCGVLSIRTASYSGRKSKPSIASEGDPLQCSVWSNGDIAPPLSSANDPGERGTVQPPKPSPATPIIARARRVKTQRHYRAVLTIASSSFGGCDRRCAATVRRAGARARQPGRAA